MICRRRCVQRRCWPAWIAAIVFCQMLASACTMTPRSRTRGLGGIAVRTKTVEVRPNAIPATMYGAAVDHVLTVPEQHAIERARIVKLTHDPALSLATREIARAAPNRLNVPPRLVDGIMAWVGLVDPPPRLVVVETKDARGECERTSEGACSEAIDALVEEVRANAQQSSTMRIGVGVVHLSSGRTRFMAALLEPAVDLDAVPANVSRGGSFVVSGRLLAGRTMPVVEITDPSERWKRIPVEHRSRDGFWAHIDCDRGDGAYQVEILAEGEHGPEVAANFPVYCGVLRPTSIEVVLESVGVNVTANQVARAIFESLHEERRKRGLAPLEWEQHAARVAASHSEDMLANHFVGHRSARTGDVADRFRRAGIRGTVIRENVARGYGPRGIHDSLMNSPGHRVNMLSQDVSHVGIGVVIGVPESNIQGAPRPIFATLNFYRKPGMGGASDLPGTLMRRVDAMRAGRNFGPAPWDQGLAKLAQRQADAVARGQEEAGVVAGFERDVFALGYRSVDRHRVDASDDEAFVKLDVWAGPLAGAVGVGVARARPETGRDGRFVLVVLVAKK